MKKTKDKKRWKQILPFCFCALLGGVLGYLGIEFLGSFWGIVLVMVSLIVSTFLQTILHEGGHLVFGLLSGYKFVSFRISSIIWVKQGEKIVRKKFTIPGTGGQCLLDPPEPKEDGSFPNLLYNLGGGLSNLLFSGLALAAVMINESAAVRQVLIPFILLGVYLAVMNLIPMKIGGIVNDGLNIKTFRKDPESARAFWLQIRINKLQQTDGMRLSEMPAAFFETSETTPEGDPLIDAIRVMKFQRLLDEKRFAEADLYGRQLLTSKNLLGQYRNMINQELLFLELIGPCRKEEIEQLYSSALKKYFNLVKCYPCVHRVMYAYAMRFSCHAGEAEKEKKAFEKAVRNYPTPGEIRTELMLMEEI